MNEHKDSVDPPVKSVNFALQPSADFTPLCVRSFCILLFTT